MKRIGAITLYLLLTSMNGSAIAEALDLEPCINGGVSSTGLYVSQALEDEAVARAEEPADTAPTLGQIAVSDEDC